MASSGASVSAPAPVKAATAAALSNGHSHNGNGSSNGTNGNGTNARPYNEAGIPTPPVSAFTTSPLRAIILGRSIDISPTLMPCLAKNPFRLATYTERLAKLPLNDVSVTLLVPGAAVHREMELLVAAGLPPLTALRAATVWAADLLRADSLGRLRPGAPAWHGSRAAGWR